MGHRSLGSEGDSVGGRHYPTLVRGGEERWDRHSRGESYDGVVDVTGRD